ncbi:MAG: hypothetical protein ACJ73U_10590 [Actinophytocola sp.]
MPPPESVVHPSPERGRDADQTSRHTTHQNAAKIDETQTGQQRLPGRGDVVAVTVEGIGDIANRVVAGRSAPVTAPARRRPPAPR